MLARGLRYISRHSLWSLRNRLLTVYALIGILPIILILILVGLGAWSLTSELAIYLASSELDRRLDPCAARPNIWSAFRRKNGNTLRQRY